MEHMISLPFGASGEAFPLKDLIKHIKDSYRDYIIQGQQECCLPDHTKPHSLDAWLRKNHTIRKDAKQVTNDLIQEILDTGLFREGKFYCPDTGRKCKGIQLV